jgi:hypothetical protein
MTLLWLFRITLWLVSAAAILLLALVVVSLVIVIGEQFGAWELGWVHDPDDPEVCW